MAEKNSTEVKTFDIIYKLTEWINDTLSVKTPKVKTEEVLGTAKALKAFSKIKDKQIIGFRVEKGVLTVGSQFKIKRKDEIIGEGKIRGLESQKNKTDEVSEGKECGAMVEAKMEIAPGDHIESYIIVEK